MADTEELPEGWVERPCDECEFVARGPAKGRGSAGWILGSHRYTKHGKAGDSGSSKRRRANAANAPTDEDRATRPGLTIVRDAASEAGAGSGRKIPTADDLTRGLGRGVGLTTVAVASYFAETDPTIPEGPQGEAQRDALVTYLSLDDKAARDVMAPIARAIAPTAFNRRFGRQVVDNVDAVGSVAELGTLFLHWRRYFRTRNVRVAALEGRVIDTTATEMVPGFAAPAAAGPQASPPPVNGQVLSGQHNQPAGGAPVVEP